MLRTILTPIEPGLHHEAALAHLWRLAPLYKARVFGLHVIDTGLLQKGLKTTEEARRLLEREARQHLASFEAECRRLGLRAVTDAVIGEPIEEIVQGAARADLLVMGEEPSHDDDAYQIQKRLVRDILHRITRPMLIARGGHERLERIVVGYDGSEKGGHALQWGADLAERSGAELVAVSAAATKELGCRLIDEATAYLDAYTLTWTPVPFEGDPAEAISRTVDETRADLVIVGTHGHGRLHELAFGSTTHYILENVPVSLLIYR